MFAALLALVVFVGDEPKHSTGEYPNSNILIEAGDIFDPAKAGDISDPAKAAKFHILDARTKEEYQKGHIPGAVWADHSDWSTKFGDGKDVATWTTIIGHLGITTDTPVVVYDDAYARDACRIWWILRYWGVKDVRVLNGGWSQWTAQGGKTATDQVTVTPTQPKLEARANRIATKAELMDSIKAKKAQIVDARSREEYCGEKMSAKRNGAMPEAKNVVWSKMVNKKTHRFRDVNQITRILEENAVELDKPTVTHCFSGGRSSVMAFVLELMGAKDVKNYYRGWAEWGNASDTPVVKPES
jgi:thiosulfate/3-mercaptopyruvate sulfurtransferase